MAQKRKSIHRLRFTVWLLLGVTVIVYLLLSFKASRSAGIGIAIVAGLVCVYYSLRYARIRVKTRNAQGELDNRIMEALRKMDSIGDYYTDEESANQQLCGLLRESLPGADIHLVKPGPKSMGDMTVGSTIIEGRVDLVTRDEMDRLVGQLQDYCSRSSSEIKVVVYGQLAPEFHNRIITLPNYYSRILLHHLENPQKRRRRIKP